MSFASVLRAAGLALVLAAPMALAGCTLTPVHGGAGQIAPLALTYAEPNSRLEQVAYQALSARFDQGGPESPEVRLRVSTGATRLGLSATRSPVTERMITATLTYSVVQNGETLASGSRQASANYHTTGQTVADDAARAGAEEQAIRAAAETVRLALIAELGAR